MKSLDQISLYDLAGWDDPSIPEVARKFRKALGSFATGVTVVTSLSPKGVPTGLTVNSFSSLSIDPPLILWCLTEESGLVGHFSPGQRFNVNFLSSDQENLALKFAQPGEDRFKDIPSHPDRNAVPLLEGCSGILNCVVEHNYPGGDHVIIVGRVLRFREEKKPPLLFHKGRFKTF